MPKFNPPSLNAQYYISGEGGPSCPHCKGRNFVYQGEEVEEVPCYDYKRLLNRRYYRCQSCREMVKQETASTVGFMRVGEGTAERIKQSISESFAPPAEPPSSPSQ